MAGMPGDTPNMVTQPEPSGSTVPPEYAPSTSYGQEPQPSPGQNVPNPIAAEVSSVSPPQSNSGTGADLNNEDMAANYGHGRGATVPGVAGGGMPFADPSQLSAPHKRAHSLGTIFSAISGPQGTPGSFWRNILAGALTGAAAGAEAKMGGGVGSFAVGAGAQIKEMQAQKERDQKQQQQEIENKREQDTLDQRRLLTQATVENMHSEIVARHSDVDFRNQEALDRHNAASLALLDGLKTAGGVDPIDKALPGALTANDLTSKYIQDNKIRQAPEGYQRHFIDLNDHSELEWNGVHWVTPAGEPANLTDQTSVKVVDVPINNMTARTATSGAELNKLMRVKKGETPFDPDKNYMVSPVDKVNLYTSGLKDEAEIGKINNEAKQLYIEGLRIQGENLRINNEIAAGNKASMAAAASELKTRIDSYGTQLKSITDPAAQTVLTKQLEAARKEYQGIREKLYPKSVLAQEENTTATPYSGSAYGLEQGTPPALAFDAVSSTQPDLNSARMALAKIPPSKLSQEDREKANRALVAHYGKAEEEKGAITNQTQQAAAENQGLSAPVPNVPYQPM